MRRTSRVSCVTRCGSASSRPRSVDPPVSEWRSTPLSQRWALRRLCAGMDSKKIITAALLLCACPADDDDGSDTNNDTGSEGDSETGECEPMTANVPAPNEAACGPLA